MASNKEIAIDIAKRAKDSSTEILAEAIEAALDDRLKIADELCKHLLVQWHEAMAWHFPLSDRCRAEVKIFSERAVTRQHVETFALLFQAVAANYVVGDTPEDREADLATPHEGVRNTAERYQL